MNRKEFIKTGCKACIAFSATTLLGSLLSSCGTTHVYKTAANANTLQIPKSAFLPDEQYKIIRYAGNDFDILLRKQTGEEYSAFLMKCTHIDNALTATKRGFTCNMHGSQFNEEGQVVQGPAVRKLQQFKTSNDQDSVTIHLNQTF